MGESNIPYSFLRSCRIKNALVREFLGEFIGTFILCIIADSAAASYVLKGGPVDGFAASFAAGIGLGTAVLTSGAISGGHINPAVTLALATVGKCKWIKVPVFFAAQYLGAFIASALVFANNFQWIDSFDYGTRSAYDNVNKSTGGLFTTYPGMNATIGGVLLDQVICTALLIFTIMALIDSRNMKIPPILIPIFLATTLCTLSIAFQLNAGAALNPARDVGGRIFTFAAGYGSDVFKPLDGWYWFVGGFLGPHLGGIVGAWLYLMLIELHHKET